MSEGAFSMVSVFPEVWPPLEDFIFVKESVGDNDVLIVCNKEGQFLISVNSLRFCSQKVVFIKAKRALLFVNWNEENGISLNINAKAVSSEENTELFEITSKEPLTSSKISFEHELAQENCNEWTTWRMEKYNNEVSPGENRSTKSQEEQFNELETAIYSLNQHMINFQNNEKALLINCLPLLRSLLFWPDGKTKNYNPLLLRLAGVTGLALPVYAFKDRIEEVKNNPIYEDAIIHRVNNTPSFYQNWPNEEIMDFQAWLNMEIIMDNVDYDETCFRWKDLIFEGANTGSASHFDCDIPFVIDRLQNSKMFNRNSLFKYVVTITQITIELGNYILTKRLSS